MVGIRCLRCGIELPSDTFAQSGCPRCRSKAPNATKVSSQANAAAHHSASRQPSAKSLPDRKGDPAKSNGAPSPPEAGYRELLLKFRCPSCKVCLSIPLRSLGIDESCPGCKAPLVTPTLDDKVTGWEFIRASLGSKKPRPAPPSVDTGKKSRGDRTDKAAATATPPVPPPIVKPSRPATQPSPSQPAAAAPKVDRKNKRDPSSPFFRVQLDESPEPVEAEEVPSVTEPTRPVAIPPTRSPGLSPRIVRYGVYFGIWLLPLAAVGFIALAGMSNGPGDEALSGICLGVCFGVPWFFAGPWVAHFCMPFLMAALYSSVRCPGCGESHPMVSRWSCGCGYNDHHDRHFMLFRCPKCSNRLGHFDCPVCEATILC